MGCVSLPSLSLFCIFCTLGPLAGGQETRQPPPSGQVTGHVLCGDTHQFAKFAQVVLLPVPTQESMQASAALAKVVGPAKAGMDQMSMVQTQTGADGAYTAEKVSVGDYYVFAWTPGYQQPFGVVRSLLQAQPDSYGDLPGIAKIHVADNRSSEADVSLQRGSVITGRVTWNDGTPVARATVNTEAVKPASQAIPPPFLLLNNASMGAGAQTVTTDDVGRYRLVGTPAGDYLVRVSFQPHTQLGITAGVIDTVQRTSSDAIVVYAPAAFYKAAASPLTIGGAEEHSDFDVTFDLDSLHIVQGQVVSSEDHHALNAGVVALEDQAHRDFRKTARVAEDGSFSIGFVPQGSYSLLVSSASDSVAAKNVTVGALSFVSQHVVTSYKPTSVAVTVVGSDVTLPPVEVLPSTARAASSTY